MHAKSKIAYFGSVLFVFIISVCTATIRDYESATDYNRYEMMYLKSTTLDGALGVYHGDITFSVLMWISNVIGLSFNEYIIFFTFLVLLIVAIGYSLVSLRYSAFALALFTVTPAYIFSTGNILRQGLASALFLLVVAFILRKRWLSLAFTFVLASFSHGKSLYLILGSAFSGIAVHRVVNTSAIKIFFYSFISCFIVGLIFVPVYIHFGLPGASIMHRLVNNDPTGSGEAILLVKIIIIWFVIGVWILVPKRSLPDAFRTSLLPAVVGMIAFVTVIYPMIYASSRFIYYVSFFIPLFIASIGNLRINEKSVRTGLPYFVALLGFCYAIFVYSYPSVIKNIGYSWVYGYGSF